MKNKEELVQAIVQQGILPLFYYNKVDVCIQTIKTLYDAGVRVMEFANRAKDAIDVYEKVKKTVTAQLPDMILGAGTIRTVKDAIAFLTAGADFLVAPNLNEGVAGIANDRNMLWIPGCMTPTEIHNAQQQHAALIKIFPANVLGPNFIRAVNEVFAGQLFMPTGGVEINKENLAAWFNAGVAAVGMGGKLVSKEILQNKLYDELHKKTTEVLQLIKEVRGR